jgi:hypothetical protein
MSRTAWTKWAIPLVALGAGLAYLVAATVAGDLELGLAMLAIMVTVGVGFVVAARWSETARGLMDRKDERINAIDKDATIFAASVLLLAILGLVVWELAHGRDGEPYVALGGLAGLSYVVSLAWLRFRR